MIQGSAQHTEIAILKALLAASEQRAKTAEARVLDLDAEIANLKLTIAKLRRDTFGASSERGAKLIDQLELQLADLVEAATEAKSAAAIVEPSPAAEVQKPARRPLPARLPRQRVVHATASACPCCGGVLRKLGEDITETLELEPAIWKVMQHVREKFSCRSCEHITQAPAPSHPIARGRAGPQLLAQVLFSKYRAHIPLNRHCRRGLSRRQQALPSRLVAEATSIAVAACRGGNKHGRHLRQGRHRPRRLDARRLGRRLNGDADAAGRGHRGACSVGGAYPCR